MSPHLFSRKLAAVWGNIIGKPGEFPLQSRIYHSVCIAVLAVIIYNIPFSIVVGLYWFALVATILSPLYYYLYVLSRYKNRTNLSRSIQLVLSYALFVVNYLANSGIDGSGMLSFAIFYFLTIVTTPQKQHFFWTVLILITIFGTVYFEYQYPEMVQNTYATKKDRFIDIGSTLAVSFVLTLLGLSYIITNYTIEKNRALQKANDLKTLNDQKNKLISIISHDYNAPLRNIRNYLKIWREQSMNEEIRDLLEKELTSVTTNTQNLLLNLLSWSRNNMDKTDVHILPVAVIDTLSDTLNVYTEIANDKSITLTHTVGKDVIVLADFDLLEIVLRNLVSNAIKFTPEGGSVAIGAEESGDQWEIYVTDSGIGISPDKEYLLFHHNFPPSYGTKREKGTGIGLTICYEFVQSMNGVISFTRGDTLTKFSVKLPKAP